MYVVVNTSGPVQLLDLGLGLRTVVDGATRAPCVRRKKRDVYVKLRDIRCKFNKMVRRGK